MQKWFLVLTTLVVGADCHAQTNVYSLSVHTKWVIGAYPLRFGLEDYRKDSAGYYVLAAGGRSVGTGVAPTAAKDHTSVILGPVGFSVPLPPLAVALSSFGLLSAIALVAAAVLRRLHSHETQKDSL
jgi:hypothetical protein